MSLGKMSRWLSVRRGSSTKEDARTRRTPSQKLRLQRHHSEGDIGELELKKGDMRIMQLRESPGVARRSFPSPVATPSPDKTSGSGVLPATSQPSLAPPPPPPPPAGCDETLDSIDDGEVAEPGYALPSMCSRSHLHASQPRTSTPLNGRLTNGVGPSTPAETPSPASSMSSSTKPSGALTVQEESEAIEDRAGGYDVVCLDTVRQVSASLPRMVSNTSVVEESVFTGPIRREQHLHKLGHRFKSWKRRWVCLQPTEVSFFKTVDMTAPSRTIMTGNVVDVFYPATVPYPGGHSFEVVTGKRTHILAAKTESDARAWVHLIQRASGKTRRSVSAQWQGSGRSSAQSDTAVNAADIEPYAQAVVPVRQRGRQAAEPTYAIATRTTPTRKEADGGAPDDIRKDRDVNDNNDDDDDDMPPPVLPPRLRGNADVDGDTEDDDSSDDGEETQDVLDSQLGETPKATQQSVHLNSMASSGSPPSSHTLLIGSASQVSGSLNNKESTLLRGDGDDGDDGGTVVFF